MDDLLDRRAKNALRWEFLRGGTSLSLTLIIAGFKGLIFFAALRAYAPEIVAGYGIVLNIIAIPTVVMSGGFSIVVLIKIRQDEFGDPDDGDLSSKLRGIFAASFLSAMALAVVLAIVGVAVALIHARSNTALTESLVVSYWARIGAVCLLPIQSVFNGILSCVGREGVRLRNTVENLILTVLLAVWISVLHPSGLQALLLIGLFGMFIDCLSLLRLQARIGPARRMVVGAAMGGAKDAFRKPREYVSAARNATAISFDALALSTTFAAMSLMASGVSAEAGAITSAVVALQRMFMPAMKSYGLTAGRLAKRRSPGQLGTARQRLQVCLTTLVWLFAAIGIICIAEPRLVALALGLGDLADSASTAIRLLGIQLLLEPFGAFIAAAIRVLKHPTLLLRAQLLTFWGGILPVNLVLSLTGLLTLELLWSAAVAFRLVLVAYIWSVYWRTSYEPTTS